MSLEKYLNKVTCGDCYELIKDLPDKSVDCVYIDIPYLIADGGTSASELSKRVLKKQNELKENGIYDGCDLSILDECKRVLKKVNMFVWCSKMQLLDIMNWGGQYNTDVLVWCKTNPTPQTNNVWLPDIEYCVYMREKGVPLNDGYDVKSKYYFSPANKSDKDIFEHPTIKPLALVRRHLLHTTQPNDIVLDCFAGSGTTGVAACDIGRNYILFEINPKWAKVAENRLNRTDANGQTSIFLV